MGNHPFLPKGPILGFSPCALVLPHRAPQMKPREASFAASAAPEPQLFSGCGQLTMRGRGLRSCRGREPLAFSRSLVWSLWGDV